MLVDGWTTVTVNTGTLKVNSRLRLASFYFGKVLAVTTANAAYTVRSNNIPSAYRPPKEVRFPCHNTNDKFAMVGTDGTLSIVSNSTGSLTYTGYAIWNY